MVIVFLVSINSIWILKKSAKSHPVASYALQRVSSLCFISVNTVHVPVSKSVTENSTWKFSDLVLLFVVSASVTDGGLFRCVGLGGFLFCFGGKHSFLTDCVRILGGRRWGCVPPERRNALVSVQYLGKFLVQEYFKMNSKLEVFSATEVMWIWTENSTVVGVIIISRKLYSPCSDEGLGGFPATSFSLFLTQEDGALRGPDLRTGEWESPGLPFLLAGLAFEVPSPSCSSQLTYCFHVLHSLSS